MKSIALAFMFLVTVLCSSCSWNSELSNVPTIEFDTLKYHRAGNTTSADINAKKSRINGCIQEIEELHVNADYGPFVNFAISITGFKRVVPICEIKTIVGNE